VDDWLSLTDKHGSVYQQSWFWYFKKPKNRGSQKSGSISPYNMFCCFLWCCCNL